MVAAGDLLTIRQALAILPLGRSTLYSLVAEGQIPSIRVGCAGSRRGRILIHREDLDAFIEKSQQTARVASTRGGMDAELTETRRGP